MDGDRNLAGSDGLLTGVRRGLAGSDQSGERAAVADLVRRGVGPLGSARLLDVSNAVLAEVSGVGVLEPLLRLPGVTDVLVNGPGPVWIDRGRGLEITDVELPDEATVRRLAERLVHGNGRRLDAAVPFADVRLSDGTRLHAVLPPVASGGPFLSLRLPARRTFTLDDLVAAGSLPARGADLLRAVVSSRLAFLVSGGTGSGKTTVLSTLLSLAAADERLVLVEDTAELAPAHPHVLRLQARPPNAEGSGGIDLVALVRQALRMRPDRLVVGEVRGAEVRELLAALNTGHEGGAGTLHANRPQAVPARIEALAALAGLSREAAHSQLAAALEVVVALERARGGHRKVAGISMLRAGDDGLVRAESAFRFDRDRCDEGPAADRLRERLADS